MAERIDELTQQVANLAQHNGQLQKANLGLHQEVMDTRRELDAYRARARAAWAAEGGGRGGRATPPEAAAAGGAGAGGRLSADMAGGPQPPPWSVRGPADHGGTPPSPPPPPPPPRMAMAGDARHKHPSGWSQGEQLRCLSCGAGYMAPVQERPEGGGEGRGAHPYAA